MCGIASIFSTTKDCFLLEDTVKNALKTLQHRGPDFQDTVTVVHPNTMAVLGHARLAIVGYNTAHQPYVVPDHLALTFNGEIYNYLDIRTDLIKKGCRFHTRGDAEVIAHAYIVYGARFLEHLDGIFAFTLYDYKEHKVLMCRDRIGVKPLYYKLAEKSNSFDLFCASEIKAFPGNPSWDSRGMCDYLHFQFCLGDNTLFKDVKRIEPGQVITFDLTTGALDKRFYWSLCPEYMQTKGSDYYNDKYYEDELLSKLHTAIRAQTPTDVEFGSYVSGGVDSSLVSMLLGEYVSTKGFSLFTGNYEKEGYSELDYADTVYEELHNIAVPYILDITEEHIVDSLENAIYTLDEPCAGPGLLGQYCLAEGVKGYNPNIKVMFGGQGGDELFGGYARYIVAYLESCILGAIDPVDRNFVVTLDTLTPIMPVLKGYEPMIKNFFSENMFASKEMRYFDLINRFKGSGFKKSFANSVITPHYDEMCNDYSTIFNKLGSVSLFSKMSYFDLKTSLQALLQVDDRVNAAFSMESRVPLLDKSLVEFAFSVPPKSQYVGGHSKGLLRRAAAGILPNKILERRDKMGFPIPLQEWYDGKGKFRDLVCDILSGATHKRLFGKFDADTLKFNRATWGKLSLCTWADRFKIGL